MSRLITFDAMDSKKRLSEHWISSEAEDYLFNEEADYALPNMVVALTTDSGNEIKYAAFGRHPSVGRCANATESCWCWYHSPEEDHTLVSLPH